MEYVDDTTLLAPSSETMEKILHCLQIEAAKIGLLLIYDKCVLLRPHSTRLLHFAYIHEGRCACPSCAIGRIPPTSILGPGSLIPCSTEAKLLGSIIQTNSSCQKDLVAKLAKANRAFFLLKPFFKHPQISPHGSFKFTNRSYRR